MRRTSSLILLGLAVFCVALAPLLREYVFPKLAAKGLTSDDAYQTVVLEARDATLIGAPEPEGKATATLVQTVRPDAAASHGTTVVWDLNLVLLDSGGRVVTEIPERYAFDAVTQVPRNCCGERVDGKEAVHTGMQYKFPFFTEKRDYNYYDAQSRTASPIHYKGTEKRAGLTVYRFEQEVPWTKVPLPSRLPGGLDPVAVEKGGMERWYTTVRRFWVEPVTGAPVDSEELHKEEMRFPPAADRPGDPPAVLKVFDGRIRMKPEWSAHLTSLAKSERSRLLLLHERLPLGLLVAGGLFFAAALLRERFAAGVALPRWVRLPGRPRRGGPAPGAPAPGGASGTAGDAVAAAGPGKAPAVAGAGTAGGTTPDPGDTPAAAPAGSPPGAARTSGDSAAEAPAGTPAGPADGAPGGPPAADAPTTTAAADIAGDPTGDSTGDSADDPAGDRGPGDDPTAVLPPVVPGGPVVPGVAEVTGTAHGTNGSSAATAYAEGTGPERSPSP